MKISGADEKLEINQRLCYTTDSDNVPFPGVEVQDFPGSHSVLCEYKERPDWLTGLLPRGSLPAKHTNAIMRGHYM